MTQDLSTAEFRCPGEIYSISRAVHLGRLAGYYPACRQCPRRGDVAGIASRQIRRLAEVDARAQPRPLFHAEGAGNVAVDDLSPQVARRIAVEFARRISSKSTSPCATAIVASDGRLATAAIFGAIVEGLRWSGCEVVDIGPASAPCAARAIDHLAADGGVYVGNARGAAHTVGLKFWVHGEPLSQGGVLDEIAASLQAGPSEATIDRPTRTFGPLRRFFAANIYLDDLRPAYHALRPLRFVLDCKLGAVVAYLEELIRNTACQVITPVAIAGHPLAGHGDPLDSRNATEGVPYSHETHPTIPLCDLGEQVSAARAHFGMQIGDDGENCRVVDERGQPVEAARLLPLLAECFDGPVAQGDELRQQTFRRMRESSAAIATDTAGRLWYACGHAPCPDALRTLTLLLVLLSRDDTAFSAVLDRAPIRTLGAARKG